MNRTNFRIGVTLWMAVLTILVSGLIVGVLAEEIRSSPYYELTAGESLEIPIEDVIGTGLPAVEKDCLSEAVPEGVEVTAVQEDRLKDEFPEETTHLIFENTYTYPVQIQKHAIEDCSPEYEVSVSWTDVDDQHQGFDVEGGLQ